MKKSFALLALLVLGTAAAFAQTGKVDQAGKVTLKNAQDSASYAFGIMLGQRNKPQITSLFNFDLVVEGLNASLKGDSLALQMVECKKIYDDYNKAAQMKTGEKNITEGKAFLAQNKSRSGVTTTASGLQYEVLTKGSGTVNPKATDKVKVHYHGTLITGDVFDSSVERNQPIVFGLNQVIKGWTEGVQLMKTGDKFRFFIPYDLAYGERAAGAKIMPFSTLVFDVELFEINPTN